MSTDQVKKPRWKTAFIWTGVLWLALMFIFESPLQSLAGVTLCPDDLSDLVIAVVHDMSDGRGQEMGSLEGTCVDPNTAEECRLRRQGCNSAPVPAVGLYLTLFGTPLLVAASLSFGWVAVQRRSNNGRSRSVG